MRRFILFHLHLANDRNIFASTQNQALSAILFLYREVLRKEIEAVLSSAAKCPERLPTVLSREEVLHLINQLSGTHKLMAHLLYGSGLRLMECVRLRFKDVDFEYKCITVRDGKGEKDRIIPLPQTVIPDLKHKMGLVHFLHEEDLAPGCGEVYLPYALDTNYPDASRERIWQYLFPAPRRSRDPRSSQKRRHHVDPSGIQRAIKEAAHRAGIQKQVTPHTLRHSFAAHLLQAGYDTQHLRFWAGVRTMQELLGHKEVHTTMIYTHVLQCDGLAVRSPLDE